MSDRIPGTSWDNPIWYRDYRIFVDDCAGARIPGYGFSHDDYDGAEDANDHRRGWAYQLDEAKAEIDEQIEEAK